MRSSSVVLADRSSPGWSRRFVIRTGQSLRARARRANPIATD
jgi:hypothetical protein